MDHVINLNIHYSAPQPIWDKIGLVYESMPYWAGYKDVPRWSGENVNLWASVEPSGIQIQGSMPEEVWNEWYCLLKKKLTEALGYEIGEPEDGYRFKYYD